MHVIVSDFLLHSQWSIWDMVIVDPLESVCVSNHLHFLIKRSLNQKHLNFFYLLLSVFWESLCSCTDAGKHRPIQSSMLVLAYTVKLHPFNVANTYHTSAYSVFTQWTLGHFPTCSTFCEIGHLEARLLRLPYSSINVEYLHSRASSGNVENS